MPETLLVFKDGLKAGLRRDSKIGRNSQALVEAVNVVAHENGLKNWTQYGGDLDQQLTTWPYPQLFKPSSMVDAYDKHMLKADISTGNIALSYAAVSWNGAGGIYQLDETPITLYNAADASSIVTPASNGSPWQLVDFGNVWGLLNGSVTIFKSNLNATVNGGQTTYDRVLVNSTVSMQTACAFRGRAIAGGFNASSFWGDTWQYIWRSFAKTQNYGIDVEIPMRQNFVMWSTIGGGDTLWLFNPAMALQGTIDNTQTYTSQPTPILFDYLRRNEMGFIVMPYQGTVRVVKPLGGAVICYGDDGVAALIPASDPAPTFGLKNILTGVGVAGRGAVGCNDDMHIWLDQFGYLWAMGADLKPERLGYTEFLNAMTGVYGAESKVVIVYDPFQKHFVIGNGTKSYVLSQTGLTEVNQSVSSLIPLTYASGVVSEGMVIPCDKVIAATGNTVSIITETMDMGMRGIKQIDAVEVGGGIVTGQTTNFSVIVQYRYAKNEAFTSAQAIVCNREGIAPVVTTGVEFRIKVTCTDYRYLEDIDYINIRWSPSDKRNVRGMNATPFMTN